MKNQIKRFYIDRALFAAFFSATLVASLSLSSCVAPKTAFKERTFDGVEQITLDRLGRTDPVVVRFAAAIANPGAAKAAVAFTPDIKGTWRFLDERTLEFTPDKPYKAGKEFELSVDTGLLMGDAARKKGFIASFTVRDAEYELIPDGLRTVDGETGTFTLSGVLATDIPVSSAVTAKMLSARLGTKGSMQEIAIKWDTEGDSKAHRFTISGIRRTTADQMLTLASDGSSLGFREKTEKNWLVPGSNDFRVLEIAATDPSCVQVRFSDALDAAQDFRGLVSTGSSAIQVRYDLDGNVLKLYNTDGWKENTPITVLEGIRNDAGKILAKQTTSVTSSAWELPELRFPDAGVILPPTDGVTVPIETKNLRGCIVEAFWIYGDSALQFLQVNDLDGDYQLERVGEPIWSDSFDFGWNDDMKNRWIPRGLDLGPLVKKYSKGMIQLRVTFRKRHIMYECPVQHADFSSLPMPSDEITLDRFGSAEKSYWDNYKIDWKTRQTYWRYREDPCHPAFYLSDYNEKSVVKKNVLVSDLGMMAKLDSDGTYHITVADIASTAPVQGAAITAYTYARKEISAGVTDKQGFFPLKPRGEAYFVTASKDGQTSYLRIDSGTSLSVSHFAVDGEKPSKGVKGFIYGERGVWRPGDDIHLVFIMQDLKDALPRDFPITFELQDPLGRVVHTAVYANSVDGFYRIDAGTKASDPTGPWIARVKAGGQSWTKSLRVEAIVPNRLAIGLKTDKKFLTARDNPFTLTGAWLYGAKTPGYKADVSVIFYPGTTSFALYPDYTFVNTDRSVESSQETVWQGALDQNSSASFNLSLNAGTALPGKLRAQLSTRVFEPSGMFSVEQVRYVYSPYDRYVGIRLPKGDAARGMILTDTKHRVDIVVVDAEGKPANDILAVSASLYKLEWKWWWEKDALTDATYVSGRSTKQIMTGMATLKNGKGTWEFEVKYPDWGRYLVVVEDLTGGHSSAKVVYIDWPGWAGRGQEAGTGSAAMLSLTQDKAAYKTGETALVSFSSGAGERALVTVEKDGAILREEWMETAQGTSVYKLPLTQEMAPNVYVHITLLQRHMQTANNLPIRLYGVVPVMVENPATRLSPVISVPSQFEPLKTATVTVSESTGRPMTYTLAVVDEGLLGLTRFTAQDPWTEFYKKEASRIESWDIYRYVMSAFGGKLETLLSIGGSEDLLNDNQKKTDRFKPVVMFFGPYELAANAKREISFEMPQYVGAVRAMVVAGKNGSYGTAEQTVPVKSDLMILPTLPRTLGTGEQIEIPVTVFNGTDKTQVYTVRCVTEGTVSVNYTARVEVPSLAEKTVSMRVTTTRAGKATFRTTAEPVSNPAGMVESVTEIDVVSRGSAFAETAKFQLAPGTSYKGTLPSPGETGSKTLSVELSTAPVLDLASRMRYLIQYPHGCIEQITSAGFPQLYLADIADTSDAERDQIKKNVLSVIDRYSGYQIASGAFAYWPGNKEPSYWGTNYAGHFLLEARKAGYDIPDALLKSWLAFQQDSARTWFREKGNDETTQAYRLYTLALSGNPDLGGMNRLSTEMGLTDAARWLLAGAYSLSGHQSTAADMTKGLALWPAKYRDTANTWGSNFRDSAIILHVLNVMEDTSRAAQMVPTIAENLGSGAWYSTQETVWMFIALAPHYRLRDASDAAWSIAWDKGSINGKIGKSATIQNLEAAEAETQNITVSNAAKKQMYGRVTSRGILPPGKETSVSKGLSLIVRYLGETGANITPQQLAQGDSFRILVTVSNGTADEVGNIALTMPLPTCWEFSNARVVDDDSSKSTANKASDEDTEGNAEQKPVPAIDYNYQDIRDSEISTYFDLGPNASKTFTFFATVTFNGDYYVPAIRTEAMYDANLQAVLPGQKILKLSVQGTGTTRQAGR